MTTNMKLDMGSQRTVANLPAGAIKNQNGRETSNLIRLKEEFKD